MKLQPLIKLLEGNKISFTKEVDIIEVRLRHDLSKAVYTSLNEFPFELVLHKDKKGRAKSISNSDYGEKGDRLRVRVPRETKNIFVGKSLNDFLNHHNSYAHLPKELVLLQISNNHKVPYWTGKEKHQSIKTYEAASKFCMLLLEKADHVSANQSVVTFFDVNRLEIPLKYTSKSLQWEFPLDRIYEFLKDPYCQNLRMEVFRSTLWSLLKDTPPEKRCANLLERGTVFLSHLHHNFAIMREDFTLARRLDKARQETISIADSINKVISGIEAKALTVPALAYLAITKIEQGAGITKTNIPLYITSIILSVILILGYLAQKKYLDPLRDTIEDEQDKLKADFSESEKKIFENLASLIRRIKIANIAKLAVMIIAVALTILILLVGSCDIIKETKKMPISSESSQKSDERLDEQP